MFNNEAAIELKYWNFNIALQRANNASDNEQN